MASKTFSLFDGKQMPAIGLGTWQSEPNEVTDAVEYALSIGYQHIDCAAFYFNEGEVGQGIQTALQKKSISRDALWVTSKLWNSFHRPEDVILALKRSLTALRLDYLDLYLMHWPIAFAKHVGLDFPNASNRNDYLTLEEVPLIETWQAMEEAVSQGLIQHIGVSNFSEKKLTALLKDATIQPAVNQVECHPYLAQPGLLDYCHQQNIVVTAYAPLGSPALPDRLRKGDEPILLSHELLIYIGEAHNATPAQIMLAWQLQRHVAVIPKSTNKERMAQNLASTNITLTENDITNINALDKHQRYFSGEFFEGEGSPYTANTIFD